MITASSSSSRVVDLELVLAVDSSASVDFAEFNSQIRGLAEAWRNPDLADLIAAALEFAIDLLQHSVGSRLDPPFGSQPSQ